MTPQDHPYVARYDRPDTEGDADLARRDAEAAARAGSVVTGTFTVSQLHLVVGALIALEIVLLWAAALLFAKRLHATAWVVVLCLAAVATAGLVWGMTVGGRSLSTVDYPYALALPVIVAAGVLELPRTRRLRACWGGEKG